MGIKDFRYLVNVLTSVLTNYSVTTKHVVNGGVVNNIYI